MTTLRKLLHVERVAGATAALGFGLVTVLVVALLAAVNLTSRYALKLYTEDQLARLPWDVAVYQQADIAVAEDVRKALGTAPGVGRTADLAFLRATLPLDILPYVDGKPLRTTWLSLLSASDPSLLPPSIRPQDGAVLALIGSKTTVGDALLALQGARQLDLRVRSGDVTAETSFAAPIGRVVRLETTELNGWFMDQVSAPVFVPSIGVVLVVPYDPSVITTFDQAARGLVRLRDTGQSQQTALVRADYFPEVTHVARIDREALISGWDLSGSLANLYALNRAVRSAVQSVTPANTVDDTAFVLLTRMNDVAAIVGLLTLLIAFPLLWMGWVLMASLSALLMLNQRRTLGLLRLRGVPSSLIGASLLIAIGGASLVGGVAGAALGTALPLFAYAGGWLPPDLLFVVQDPRFLILFVLVGFAITMFTSGRFIAYATAISPLEASARYARSEVERSRARFGLAHALALAIGSYKLVSWVVGGSFGDRLGAGGAAVERVLDFAGFPLFVYGLVYLVASRERWTEAFLSFTSGLVGGKLRPLFLRHVAMKPHRVASFLLIMALMTSVSLYPTITQASFEDKVERGARVQIGTDLQFVLNTIDLVDYRDLKRGLADQVRAISAVMDSTSDRLRALSGVRSAGYLINASTAGVYVPGYAESGVPLFLVDDPITYLGSVYHEPELGSPASFDDVVAGLARGDVAVSGVVADFWGLHAGSPLLVGKTVAGKPVAARVAGTLAALPGMPSAAVTDRQGFVSARVDYLNYLFASNAYIVAAARNSALADLEVLSPTVVVRVALFPGAPVDGTADRVRAALPAAPLSARTLPAEVGRVGADMFIALATQNLRIYLVGGLLIALLGILAVAVANYLEDRRTLALLRIRGAGPRQVAELFAMNLLAPSVAGLALGALVALAAGYGIANLVWRLREIATIAMLLPTHLRLAWTTAAVAAVLVALVAAATYAFGAWAFRRSARERLGG